MQEGLDEANVPHGKFSVKQVMDTWVKQAGYPLVNVTRNYSSGSLTLTQRRYLINTEPEDPELNNGKWWIPISIVTRSNMNFSSTTPTHWMKPTDEHLTIDGIDPNDWVIVNVQSAGDVR